MTVRAALAAALLLAGAHSAAAEGATVAIDNFAFTPAQITIAPGATLTWVNHDDIPHAIVATGAGVVVKSPVLDTDEQFTATFAAPGSYGYFCSMHPHMQGTVVVR